MKKLIILCIYCFSSHLSYCQPYDPGKVDKKAIILYNQGMERAQDGNLTLAAGLFLKSIETDNKYLDAYLAVASVYSQLKVYKSSAEYFEKAFVLDSAYTMD